MSKNLTSVVKEALGKPYAKAVVHGSALAPDISGEVEFFNSNKGSIVLIELTGLPEHIPAILDREPVGPFGFHIHEGSTCGLAMGENAFESAGAHYNPTNSLHPEHAGDLPVVFSNNGYAWMAVYTNRFKPSDVINKTVMLHRNPDDFRSQPSGKSGVRIACGTIEKVN